MGPSNGLAVITVNPTCAAWSSSAQNPVLTVLSESQALRGSE